MLIFLQSCFVSQKSLYNEEKNGNATITKVNVPMFLVKPFIKKTLREDGSSEDVINLIKKIRKVKVYVVENASDKMVADFSAKTFGNNMQEFVSISSKDSKIKILSKETRNPSLIKNLMLSVRDDHELVYVKILGKFSLDDIANITNVLEKNKERVVVK